MKKAAYISDAGLDGIEWLRCTDPIESLVTVAVAEEIHSARAEAYERARQG